jgi:hypothetical protein
MHCILCQLFPQETKAEVPRGPFRETTNRIPEPVIQYPATGDHRALEPYQGRGPAPGSRAPQLTDARYQQRPGWLTSAIKNWASAVTAKSMTIGPTDALQPMPRSAVEAGHLRAVCIQYVQPGGPAMTAPNTRSWGWIHNYGYLTIGDTQKPAQQLPRYNLAAVDTQSILDRARQQMLRAFGMGE